MVNRVLTPSELIIMPHRKSLLTFIDIVVHRMNFVGINNVSNIRKRVLHYGVDWKLRSTDSQEMCPDLVLLYDSAVIDVWLI